MKTIGIAVDNYKLEQFEKELTLKEYKYDVSNMTKDTKLIRIQVNAIQYNFHKEQIRRLCVRLEMKFKRSN